MKVLLLTAAAVALAGPAAAQAQFSSGPKGYGWQGAAPAGGARKTPSYGVAPAPYHKPPTYAAPAAPKPPKPPTPLKPIGSYPAETFKPYQGPSVYGSGPNAAGPYAPKPKKPAF